MHKVLELAHKEIGYSESPAGTNKTKFGKWFGFDGVAWCAMFVSWCYYNAGFPLGNIGFLKGFAGCMTGYHHFLKTGEIIPYEKAQPGDIFLVDWQGDGRFDHNGLLLEKIGDPDFGNEFRTIEGNTSMTNQSNGGQVQLRKRDRSKAVFVFVHPKILDKK
jgi:hypothetical protein